MAKKNETKLKRIAGGKKTIGDAKRRNDSDKRKLVSGKRKNAKSRKMNEKNSSSWSSSRLITSLNHNDSLISWFVFFNCTGNKCRSVRHIHF